jgi:hypothetical protein
MNRPKSKAIFTLVQNESYFLPLWIQYYCRYFEHVFVLDHDTTDGSTDSLPDNVHHIRLSHPYLYDHVWMNNVANEFQRELLKTYEVVMFAEVDEFVVGPTEDLGSHIDSLMSKNAFIRCTGIELVEDADSQRTKMVFDPRYDKVLISSVPCKWGLGFHDAAGVSKSEKHPDTFLVHLHRANKEEYLKRKLAFIRRRADYANESKEWGYQNKFTTLQDILDYYYRDRASWQDVRDTLPVLARHSFFSKECCRWPL